jgi:hypothetical protein
VGQTAERRRHLLLVALGLGLDRDLDHRIGELDALQHHRGRRVTQCFARRRAFEAGDGHDVAGVGQLYVFAVVGMHMQHAADALLSILDGVEHLGAAFKHAGIDPHEGQRSDKGIGHDLEGERRQRLAVVGSALERLIAIGLDALDGRHVGGRRKKVDHGIEQRLNALVLERRAAQHRHKGKATGAAANAALERFLVGLATFEVGLHRAIVLFNGELDHLLARLDGPVSQVGGNFGHLELGAERLVLPDDRLHGDQVDHALVLGLRPDRNLNHQGLGAQPIEYHPHAAIEIGANAVHLVDEADTRHPVLVGLAPDRLGLRLDAGHRVEHRDAANARPRW